MRMNSNFKLMKESELSSDEEEERQVEERKK